MDVVIGAEDTERHKPDPDPVLEALRRLGAEPADAAYVGDSPFDIRAAKAGARGASRPGVIHPDERLLRRSPTRSSIRRRNAASTRPGSSPSSGGSSSTTTTATTSSTTRRFPTAPTTRSTTS